MSVVRFEATVENGSIIIPTEFRNRVKGKVEVSVHFEDKSDDKDKEPYDILTELMENPIRDPAFVPFKRDEIYDREKDRAENFINWLIKNPLKVDKSIPFLTRDEIYDRKL